MSHVGAAAKMLRSLAPLLLCAVVVLTSGRLFGQGTCSYAPYIASDVSLATSTNLPQDVEASTKAALIGQCFNSPSDPELVSGVQRVLRDMGYLRSTVSAPTMTLVDASRYPQRASLTFTVHPGPGAQVHEIEISGYNFIDADQIRSVVQVPLGEFLEAGKVRVSAHTIQNLDRANGFSRTTVRTAIEFSTEAKVRVIFQINEGPHF